MQLTKHSDRAKINRDRPGGLALESTCEKRAAETLGDLSLYGQGTSGSGATCEGHQAGRDRQPLDALTGDGVSPAFERVPEGGIEWSRGTARLGGTAGFGCTFACGETGGFAEAQGAQDEDAHQNAADLVSSYRLVPRPYSNSRVDRAGNFLSRRTEWPPDPGEWDRLIDESLEMLSAWRSLHALPLEVIAATLARRTRPIEAQAIFAQRLKRSRSIREKLMREPNMALTTMQDIAGCRAVVRTIGQAYRLKQKYENYANARPNIGPELIQKWTKDYIKEPKPDGYRSIHLVFKYRSKRTDHDHLNGLRVELQIRSQLQHAWAMAVETASAITNQALKAGKGEDEWKQFFKLMGDVVALREECPLLADLNGDEIRKEARVLARKLKVIPMLEGMSAIIETFSGNKEADVYLLILDAQKRHIKYQGFREAQFDQATEEYSNAEKIHYDDPDVNVVLVAVSSLDDLKGAYPSYFLDSSNFIALIKQLLESQ